MKEDEEKNFFSKLRKHDRQTVVSQRNCQQKGCLKKVNFGIEVMLKITENLSSIDTLTTDIYIVVFWYYKYLFVYIKTLES